MSKGKLVVSKRAVFYLCFFIAFIRPEYLIRIPFFSVFYDYYRIIVVGVVLFLFLRKQIKPNIYTFLWAFFEVWIVGVTLLRGGNISFALKQAMTILAIALFWQMFSNDGYRICKVLYILLGVFIVVNFFTLLIFPDGMYVTGVTNTASENWFLGFKNKHMIYFLPFIGLSFIFAKTDGFGFKKLCMIILVVVSAIYENSSTTIVCLGIMLLIGFLPFIRKHYRIFNMYSYFGVSILMFVLVPLCRLQYLFSYLIVTVLHKNIDLTYRTDLWDRAFSAIKEHIVVGWGEQVNSVKHALYNSQSIISAHNQILEYLYIGGIVLFVIYVVINLCLAKKLRHIEKNDIVQIASGIYLALQMALIVEVYTDAIIYMLYFLLWYIDGFTKNELKKRYCKNE